MQVYNAARGTMSEDRAAVDDARQRDEFDVVIDGQPDTGQTPSPDSFITLLPRKIEAG